MTNNISRRGPRHPRHRLAGVPADVVHQLVTAQQRADEVAALPTPDCPSWCSLPGSLPPGRHGWEVADGPRGDGRIFRAHEHHISGEVTVVAEEVRAEDGTTSFRQALVWLGARQPEKEDLTPAEAYELARQLREAALLTERINREAQR